MAELELDNEHGCCFLLQSFILITNFPTPTIKKKIHKFIPVVAELSSYTQCSVWLTYSYIINPNRNNYRSNCSNSNRMWQTNKSNNVKAPSSNGIESSVSVQVQVCLFKDAVETCLKWTKRLWERKWFPQKGISNGVFITPLQFWYQIFILKTIKPILLVGGKNAWTIL